MSIATRLNWFIAHCLWNPLPAPVQLALSRMWSLFYRLRISCLLIPGFCALYGLDATYLEQFEPAADLEWDADDPSTTHYRSFQDFFTRRLKSPLVPRAEHIWPCEGYVCEHGPLHATPRAQVKGVRAAPELIFGVKEGAIDDGYFFANIFLHNHNYHRFHAPVSGTVTRIQRIHGKLWFLRPWLYRPADASAPAFRNERVNVDIVDPSGRTWYLSLIGGMGVGTIALSARVALNSCVTCGQEIGLFKLGSTCCLAIPGALNMNGKMKLIRAGEELPLSKNGRGLGVAARATTESKHLALR